MAVTTSVARPLAIIKDDFTEAPCFSWGAEDQKASGPIPLPFSDSVEDAFCCDMSCPHKSDVHVTSYLDIMESAPNRISYTTNATTPAPDATHLPPSVLHTFIDKTSAHLITTSPDPPQTPRERSPRLLQARFPPDAQLATSSIRSRQASRQPHTTRGPLVSPTFPAPGLPRWMGIFPPGQLGPVLRAPRGCRSPCAFAITIERAVVGGSTIGRGWM